jgi:hypothetical protein
MSFITPNNNQNETFNIYGFKTTKGIKICSHNVNRMLSRSSFILYSKFCDMYQPPPQFAVLSFLSCTNPLIFRESFEIFS